jgi:RNA polymerase sigma factor (sigma-70 family)
MSESQNLILKDIHKLVLDCCREDRSAQSRLYNLLAPKMFVVCLRYSKSREEAEEILQEGFMKVFQSIRQFRFSGSFEGWVKRIMINCALQRFRKKTHLHAIIHIDDASVEPISQEAILSRMGTKELLALVQDLPAAYRLVFNLYVFEGMKHREIAELLGISEGTSKSNLSDARSILKKAITEKMEIRSKNINCL